MAAYKLSMPDIRTTSVVFASPHSGREYPWSFVRRTTLDEKTLSVTTIEPIAQLPEALKALGAVLVNDHRLEVQYRPSQARVGEILDAVRALGLGIRDLQTVEADLEELFLRLTGNGSRVETSPPS